MLIGLPGESRLPPRLTSTLKEAKLRQPSPSVACRTDNYDSRVNELTLNNKAKGKIAPACKQKSILPFTQPL